MQLYFQIIDKQKNIISFVEITKAFENLVNANQNINSLHKEWLLVGLSISKHSRVYWETHSNNLNSNWNYLFMGGTDEFGLSAWQADLLGAYYGMSLGPYGMLGFGALGSALSALSHT